MHKFYSKDDLSILQKKEPELYQRVHQLAHKANYFQTMFAQLEIQTVSDSMAFVCLFGELLDLFQKLPIIYKELQTCCKHTTGHLFFLRIEDFNNSAVKYQIALALYEDIVELNTWN